MRLSSYPFVTVRIACKRCSRHGTYRLARLADRYGAEMHMPHLLELLSGDCKWRARGRIAIHDRCGAFFPDIGRMPPTPVPSTANQCRCAAKAREA